MRRAADPKAVDLVAVGSDGAYDLSPRFSIERPDGAIIRLDRVTPERAARAAAEPLSAAGSEADYGDFWTAQRRLLARQHRRDLTPKASTPTSPAAATPGWSKRFR